MNDIDVVFFDLFFTLVTPKYNDFRNENDVLGLTKEEWERYAEDGELYLKRATSKELTPQKIVEAIIEKMRVNVSERQKIEILKLREERFKKSLIEVDSTVLEVLSDIKKNGKKICLISNADVIDVLHWEKSPLHSLFDGTVFSYEVGYLKPQREIYKIALKRMRALPENCIFIGDGGSDELKGAKELGVKTIQTEYLIKREKNPQNTIAEFADYYVDDFKEIRNIIFDLNNKEVSIDTAS
jgi:haloacid dehalogenase superfamily, subfamily IA, variant 3 with third motif having DD or ED/haloacid dehalogenase superfamily, subfamily IA, variant 1 with third motif having Dx(3-4)D or Dx(3-4)E